MKIIYLLSLFAIMSFSTPSVFADELNDYVDNLEEPVNFEMEILLNNVIEVDRLNGNYKLDF
jgi:hypothetical protein